MRIDTISPAEGARTSAKRLGRGIGSGLGKTSGKGHKGQWARSGGGVRPGFEGGQMPLHRRLPKKGFNNARFKSCIAIVNLCQLEAFFEAGATVTENELRAAGLVKGDCDGVKLLGNGNLSKALNVTVDFASKSVAEKIQAAGGTLCVLSAQA